MPVTPIYKTAVRVLVGVVLVSLVTVAGFWIKSAVWPDAPEAAAGFREEAAQAGITFRMAFLPGEQGETFKINLYDHGCGVAVGDFDGDGHDDLYFCNQLGKNGLFRNKGDGTFEDVTDKAGVGLGDRVCVAATWADTRNCGLPDLYVTSTRGGNVLFRNKGDGTFEDVTQKAGLVHVGHSQTAVFFDYDNDGFLDLFVTNTAQWTEEQKDASSRYYIGPGDLWQMAARPKERNILYHNNGDGTFTDVTQKAGLKGQGWGGDVVVFDYDEDGRLDLLVTNMFGAQQLYRNNGDGTFADVTQSVLGRTSWGAIGAKAFDFNNDGHLDLFIVDMHSDMWLQPEVDPRKTDYDLKTKYTNVIGPFSSRVRPTADTEEHFSQVFNIHREGVVFGNTLFKKLPSGKFAEVSDSAGMETWWPWGVATGDFDNNGFEDVFIPSGMGYPYWYWPNALMMNNGNETFTDRARDLGIDPPPDGEYADRIGGKRAARSSRCAAVADFSGEGRLDLVVNNFNDRAHFYRNHFPQKNYVAFRLTGTQGNRDAIGALVRLHVGSEVMVRQVQAAGGYLSQSSRTLHFGLGDRDRIDYAEVLWPGRTVPERIEGPAINTLHRLTEPKT